MLPKIKQKLAINVKLPLSSDVFRERRSYQTSYILSSQFMHLVTTNTPYKSIFVCMLGKASIKKDFCLFDPFPLFLFKLDFNLLLGELESANTITTNEIVGL